MFDAEAIDALTSDDGDHVSEPTSDEDDETDSEEMDVDESDFDRLDLQTVPGPSPSFHSQGSTKWSELFTEQTAGPSLKPPAITLTEPVGPDTFMAKYDRLVIFFDALTSKIFEEIVQHTNCHINRVLTKLTNTEVKHQEAHGTNISEIRALVGLLYTARARSDVNGDIQNMWKDEHAPNIYQCTMSYTRFKFLCSYLRFDDKATRNRSDNFAPVRKVWENFIANCKLCCNIGEKVTVGQMLLGFNNHCPFRVRRKSTFGDKYGIELITLNDARTGYLLHAVPYLGRGRIELTTEGETNAEYFFRKVTEPIHGSGRSVTCDGRFASIPMIDGLLHYPFNLKITGELTKHATDIPQYMKTAPHVKFCATENVTLMSHNSVQNRLELIASSYIKSTGLTNEEPDILLYYNKTKGGSDMFERICQTHSVAMRTNRWPLRFFLGMLDMAAANSHILYKWSAEKAKRDVSKMKMCESLQQLALYLMRPHLHPKLAICTLPRESRICIEEFLGEASFEAYE